MGEIDKNVGTFNAAKQRNDELDRVELNQASDALLLRYGLLRAVFDDAYEQASGGKGAERHDPNAEQYEDQQIVQLCEWMGSNHGDIFQACKKAIESCNLPPDRARKELLGAINYLAAAVIVLDRAEGRRVKP